MSKTDGASTLLPEPFEVRKDAVDRAAPAARAAAARISQAYPRPPSGPHAPEPDPTDKPTDP